MLGHQLERATMQCPICNSDNTQRLEVVYHGGTQDINTTGATIGGAHGGGLFGWGGAVTKTTGQSQSILAQRAAPPMKMEYKRGIIFSSAGFLTLAVGSTTGAMLAGAAILATGCYFIFTAFQFNAKQLPGLYQHWQKSWLCNKCGEIYKL